MTAASIWILATQAPAYPTEERAAFAAALRDAVGPAAPAWTLVTCHRVELFGAGEAEHARAMEAAASAGLSPRRYERQDAVLHLFRLAAGLESAVIGEDEILHQVRELHDEVCATAAPDAAVVRALEMALSVGRRARAGRARPHERSLADRALDRAGCRGDGCREGHLLVVGAGAMGRALAIGARRRGARVTVASRTPEHAREVAGLVDGNAAGLDEAVALIGRVDAVAVALSGRWVELTADALRAATDASVPFVDLSSPAAVPPAVRAALGAAFVGVDELFPGENADEGSEELRAAYVAHAERLVQDAADRYERWIAARPSIDALRALRETAEARRAAELDRLLRRLPDLDPRERALVTAFSEQLVASILHPPSARLHDDADGRAAHAARLLFDL